MKYAKLKYTPWKYLEAWDMPVTLTLGRDQTLTQQYERTAKKSTKNFDEAQIFRTEGGNQNHIRRTFATICFRISSYLSV